jgi:hypothetical protein
MPTRQQDELLLYSNEQQAEQPAVDKQRLDKELAAAKDRLRHLTDLQKHPGYVAFQEAMATEVHYAFLAMDKATDPTTLARQSGNHYAATMAIRYVDAEIARLRALLQSVP